MLLRHVIARVLDDALARPQRQVQPSVARIALLKTLDDAQRVKIVIEPQTVMAQAIIQRAFPCMPERWMPDVMDERKRLGKVDIKIECGRDVASHLRDLHRVSQAAAEMVRCATREYLRLTRQPAERARLHNAVAVALKGRAIVAGGSRKRTSREHALVFTEDTQGMQVVNHRLSVA